MLDITKPLQLSDGTQVDFVKSSIFESYVVAPKKGFSVYTDGFLYEDGAQMEFRIKDLKHVCSELTLENVKVGLDLTKPIQTRDGRRVVHVPLPHRKHTQIYIDIQSDNQSWSIRSVTPDERVYDDGRESFGDIINVPEIRTYGDVLQNSGIGVNVTMIDGKIIKLEIV